MILHELHDAPASGHLGREKTFLQVSNVFWWPHQYKWVANYVRSCEQCQRIKPAGKNRAPLHPLPIPQDCWKSVSMDFVFGFPEDAARNTGIVVFVDRLSKMVHIAPVRKHVTAEATACLFLEHVFRYHGLPESIVSDRDPRFTAAFWRELFRLLGTDLAMSTADHPETDGQTERANRVVEDIIRSIAVEHPRDWSKWLPYAEFAMNNSVHSSTTVTPFYFNALRHPRVPTTLFEGVERSAVGGHLAALIADETCAAQLHGEQDLECGDGQHDDAHADKAVRQVQPRGEQKLGREEGLHSAALAAKAAQLTQPQGESELVRDDSHLLPAHATHEEGIARRAVSSAPAHAQRSSCLPPVLLDDVQNLFSSTANNSQSGFGNNHDGSVEPDRLQSTAFKRVDTVLPSALKRENTVRPQTDTNTSQLLATLQGNNKKTQKAIASARLFVDERAALLRRVRDQLAAAQDKQKFYADRNGRKNKEAFMVGDKVLLSIKNLPNDLVTTLPSGSKLLPRFVGPYTVVEKIGDLNYKLDLPTRMRTHPVFYVGLLKRYSDFTMESEDHYPRSQVALRPAPQQPDQQSAGGAKEPSHAAHSARGRALRYGALQPVPRAQQKESTRALHTSGSAPHVSGSKPKRTGHEPPAVQRGGAPKNRSSSCSVGPSGQASPMARAQLAPRSTQASVRQPLAPRSRAPPVPLTDSRGEKHYHVERLLRSKRQSGRTLYLVKWRGYALEQSSWEPAERLLQDVPDMVAAFEASAVENGSPT